MPKKIRLKSLLMSVMPKKIRVKSLLMSVMLLSTIGMSVAQQKEIKYQGGRKVITEAKNILKTDTIYKPNKLLGIDTLLIRHIALMKDSVIKIEPAESLDSLLSIRDSIVQYEVVVLDTIIQFGSPIEAKNFKIKREKKNFFRDTISAGNVTLLSFIPGLGQAYNRQFWKIPVIYGALGGFVTGGILNNQRYNINRAEWQRTVNMNLPQWEQDHARGKMQNAGTMRTLFFSAAAVTYLYQIADATFNYRGEVNNIRKATTLAMIFPGAGFIYTRTYWRLPIYYGGFAAVGTVVSYNNINYKRYGNAYNAATDGDPTTVVEPNLASLSTDVMRNARDQSRRNRDLGIIGLVGIYILSVVDAHVIATLKNWDVNPDLTIRVEPTIISNTMNRSPAVPSGAGLSLKVTF